MVLKFGGTSVSTAANWHNIAQVLKARLAEGLRPAVVHSALSGITDRLESLLTAAMTGNHAPVLEQIEDKHRALAASLGLAPDGQFDAFMQELRQLAAEIAQRGRLDDEIRACVMAEGELLATCIGCAFLNAQGIATAWIEARSVLRAEERESASQKASLLSATCDFTPDAGLQAAWRSLDQVVITQDHRANAAVSQCFGPRRL